MRRCYSCILKIALSMTLAFIGIVGFASCKDDGEINQPQFESEYSISLDSQLMEMDLFASSRQILATTMKDFVECAAEIVWESANPMVVTVDQYGVVTPVGVGETKIFAKWQGEIAECTVIVNSNSVPVIKVDQTSLGFIYNVSSAYLLDAWVLYKNKEYRDEAEISYSIPEEGQTVATVDQNGLVTPVGVGETELTVKAKFRGYDKTGMTIKIPVVVSYDVEINLSLNENQSPVLYVNEVTYNGTIYANQTSLTYNVKQMGEGGMAEVTGANVSWKTSNEEVATIENGIVTAIGAGEVSVWCEYEIEGYACKSNAIELTVNPYAVVENIETKVLLDKSNPKKLPDVSNIFGDDYTGTISAIAINGKNFLSDGELELSKYEDGYYEVEIANDQNYAYIVKGVIVSVSAEAEGISFGVIEGEKVNGDSYYNLVIPEKSEISSLMNEGYKALKIGYTYNSNASNAVSIQAKYESELNHNITPNIADEFSFNLNTFLDRYEDLDEFSRSEFAFKTSEEFGELLLSSLAITTVDSNTHTDFNIDRGTTISGFSISQTGEKEGVKAQVVGSVLTKKDGRVQASSLKGASKDKVAQWLNEGYDTYTVKYYLEYDETKMTKPITAFAAEYQNPKSRAIVSEVQNLVANQWAEITLPLGAYFVTRNLFDLDLKTADNGSEMQYTLYIASINASKSDNETYDIRLYSGYAVEMWTSSGSPKGLNEYNKQIDDKTANFYTTLDVEGKYQWGCTIKFYTALNITVEQLETLKAEGYTTLDFDIYAKTSAGSPIDLRINPEKMSYGKEIQLAQLNSGEWTTVSIDLDLLIDYYSTMNGCSGTNYFFMIYPTWLDVSAGESMVYELGVGKIMPSVKA